MIKHKFLNFGNNHLKALIIFELKPVNFCDAISNNINNNNNNNNNNNKNSNNNDNNIYIYIYICIPLEMTIAETCW